MFFKPKFEKEDSDYKFSLTLERDRMSSRFEASLSSMSELSVLFLGGGVPHSAILILIKV